MKSPSVDKFYMEYLRIQSEDIIEDLADSDIQISDSDIV